MAAAASPAAAQDLKPAVFGVAAAANVYRSEDRSFGTALNVGAGLGIEWKRLGLDGRVHRTIDAALSLRPEFRTYSSVAMSRVNLGLHHGAIAGRQRR